MTVPVSDSSEAGRPALKALTVLTSPLMWALLAAVLSFIAWITGLGDLYLWMALGWCLALGVQVWRARRARPSAS